MRAHDASGLGNLLTEDDSLFFSSAVSDHCAAIANMFNATGCCTDEHVVEACEDLVYLQCWPHLPRAVFPHTDRFMAASCRLLTAVRALLAAGF